MTQLPSMPDAFDVTVPVIVVGAGGCGLCAALAVRDAGVEVLVLERDVTPLGSTAMSTGLIPAAGTSEQRDRGIEDSPARFVMDIMAKTKGRTDEAYASSLADASVETVEWLRGRHEVPLSLVDGFLYPGHSAKRMYGTPNRSGAELMGALQRAALAAGADILTQALVEDLYADPAGRVRGVRLRRPDGAVEDIGCEALILACCGFGGDAQMVARFIPEMASAVYHGHLGNRGDAVAWGQALGAAVADMTGYQGHGGLAAGHGVPILWPLIMEGGVQVNAMGRRFSNEAAGYSEQAAKVNAQPGRIAWSIFDERLHRLMLGFEDYKDALIAGAVLRAATLPDLAELTGLPPGALAETLDAVGRCVEGAASDPWGRDFTGKPPLASPFYAAKVTGALFHTQGGLVVDGEGRVLRDNGTPLPNLFAGGGAARGISGPDADGYLAGNGLLTATTLGKLAGRAAARQVAG
jgi:fumarate reductase flavoprotein subunit